MHKQFRSAIFALAVALGVGGACSPFQAHAQALVWDPLNFTNTLLTQIRNLESNINELEQIRNQVKQYENMVKNTDSLLGGGWNSGAQDAISRLTGVLQQGDGIAISAQNYETMFKAHFPGYKPETDYASAYKKWNQTSRDSVLGALRAANMQLSGISTERQALDMLRAAAGSTTGQKQALDASNQIAVAQIEQLQQLRELMAAQLQANGSYMAAQTQADAAAAANVSELTKFHSARDGVKPGRIELERPSH